MIRGKVFSGSIDGVIKAWDDNWRSASTLQAHFSAVWALTSCHNRLLSASGDWTIGVWGQAPATFDWTLLQRLTGHDAPVGALACLADGEVFDSQQPNQLLYRVLN